MYLNKINKNRIVQPILVTDDQQLAKSMHAGADGGMDPVGLHTGGRELASRRRWSPALVAPA